MLRVFVVLVALGAVAAGESEPTGFRKPSTYEQEIMDLALPAAGRVIDPAPEGKRMRRIYVRNFDVFLPSEGRFLTWANNFHVTTKRQAMAREVILHPGDRWQRKRVEEAERKLRNRIFTTLAIIVPVKTRDKDTVDVFVLTRDVWSLRLNSNWNIQDDRLATLYIGLSENNLFGLRKQLVANFSLRLGEIIAGPSYYDSNLVGSRLRLSTYSALVWGRESGQLEGSESSIAFSRPFWSLRSRWSWTVSGDHRAGYDRSFVGATLRTYDVPETADVEAIPFEYYRYSVGGGASASYSISGNIIHRFSLGYSFRINRPTLPDGLSDVEAMAFERDILPRSERRSGPSLGYSLFRNNYHNFVNMDLYGLPESRNLGPSASLSLFGSPKLLGSTNNFANVSASVGWSFRYLSRGYATADAGASARLQSNGFVDRTVSASAKTVTPPVSIFRFASRASVAARFREENNSFYTIGGDSGLRGFPIGAFAGQRRVLFNFEVRTMPVSWWVTQFGGLIFYDAGHAANTFDDLAIKHNVGFGLRIFVPQMGSIINRFDLAFPLNGPNAGTPRFVAGVEQVF